MKFKKTFAINPEDEERGFLLWWHLVYGQYNELFMANLIAVVFLFPACYVAYVFINTMNLAFQVLFILLMGIAGPALTLLSGTACRISLRRPVWLKEDFVAIVKGDLVKSILLGLLVGLVWSVIFDALYLLYGAEGIVTLPLLLMSLVYIYLGAGFTFFSFQQLAMMELSFGRILLNGLLLIFAGRGHSVLAIVLPVVFMALCRYYYGIGFLVILSGLPALVLMTSNLIYAPVFTRLFLERKDEE